MIVKGTIRKPLNNSRVRKTTSSSSSPLTRGRQDILIYKPALREERHLNLNTRSDRVFDTTIYLTRHNSRQNIIPDRHELNQISDVAGIAYFSDTVLFSSPYNSFLVSSSTHMQNVCR